MHAPRATLAATVAATAVAAFSGCATTGSSSGSKSFTGPAKDVAQTISDFSSAANKQDAKTICTQIFTPGLQQRLSTGNTSCQDVITDQLKDSDLATLATQSVQVNGNHATAVVKSQFYGKDQNRTLTLERGVGGAWRISGIKS